MINVGFKKNRGVEYIHFENCHIEVNDGTLCIKTTDGSNHQISISGLYEISDLLEKWRNNKYQGLFQVEVK